MLYDLMVEYQRNNDKEQGKSREREIRAKRVKEKRERWEVEEEGLGWLSLGLVQREKATVEKLMRAEGRGRRRRRGRLSTEARSVDTNKGRMTYAEGGGTEDQFEVSEMELRSGWKRMHFVGSLEASGRTSEESDPEYRSGNEGGSKHSGSESSAK
ncbi:hypothetical protein Cgig2_009838 [Carnegiea gigantea]|uniref:Uncharacterized protein n=1 Tax=Carnegiea gigantea TaxID=171969 RepID=A0A9Q1KLU0_9CARY|nr:hypothetical protein Cgig2_009838 [Carnegiea gigantea]